MLQKLMKSSGDSKPFDLPPPPSVDQMLADLSKLRPNDPLLQLASFNSVLDDIGENPTVNEASPGQSEISQKLSKLVSLCDEIRDAGDLLGEKRMQLKALARSAFEKRDELEGIVSWSTAEASTESGEEKTEEDSLKSD